MEKQPRIKESYDFADYDKWPCVKLVDHIMHIEWKLKHEKFHNEERRRQLGREAIHAQYELDERPVMNLFPNDEFGDDGQTDAA